MSDQLSARPAAEHTHHWLIGNQDGPSSPAVCKDCGERREFSNGFTRRKSSWMTRSQSAQQDTPTGS
jgi:hypothetical protein